jgi:hypothetical protein
MSENVREGDIMPKKEEPVDSLGKFVERVTGFRVLRKLAKHNELWFRGESKD